MVARRVAKLLNAMNERLGRATITGIDHLKGETVAVRRDPGILDSLRHQQRLLARAMVPTMIGKAITHPPKPIGPDWIGKRINR